LRTKVHQRGFEVLTQQQLLQVAQQQLKSVRQQLSTTQQELKVTQQELTTTGQQLSEQIGKTAASQKEADDARWVGLLSRLLGFRV